MPEQHHVCPYAAALSDDEDASYHAAEHQRSPSPTHGAGSILQEARLKCPAFANNAPCPFREAGSDPESLREVMKTVPPSHFPSSSDALQKIVTAAEGGGDGGNGSAAAFQLAMEHVHTVSNLLEHGQKQNQSDGNNNQNTDEAGEEKIPGGAMRGKLDGSSRDSFIIRGGCPFKSYHKDHSRNGEKNAAKNLARAMEGFSLAAIMGRLASESFDDAQDLADEEGGETFQPGGSVAGDLRTPDGERDSTASDHEGQSGSSTSPTGKTPRKRSFLSHALKTGTAESHTAAENVHFVDNFIKGVIDRELFAELTTGLYHTYVTLETLLEEHAPTHFGSLHFPKELNRTEALREDMEYWHGLNWESKRDCITPSPAVQDYIDRMKEVGRLDPLLLLSHAYTRYLGDLSGGKVLSRIARRALNLDGYDGLQFYTFEHVQSAKLFKDKYRQALDELVLKPNEIGKLVAEANVAFALNMRVFEELDVRGGVEGARVRNVREALAYYDIEIEEQKRGRSGSFLGDQDGAGEEEEEKSCPFGFKGGPNPHQLSSKKEKKAHVPKEEVAPMPSPSMTEAVETKQHSSGEGGRCPWPFVFFHDPATGMKDWQTWFVIGLGLCWLWSHLQ